MAENFEPKFYSPIVCSYLLETAKFYSIISNSDKVIWRRYEHAIGVHYFG